MVDTTAKKTSYIGAVVAAVQQLQEANDTLTKLKLSWTNEYNVGQTLALVDADFIPVGINGSYGYMTAAQFHAIFNNLQGPVATAITNNLQAMLAVVPQ